MEGTGSSQWPSLLQLCNGLADGWEQTSNADKDDQQADWVNSSNTLDGWSRMRTAGCVAQAVRVVAVDALMSCCVAALVTAESGGPAGTCTQRTDIPQLLLLMSKARMMNFVQTATFATQPSRCPAGLHCDGKTRERQGRTAVVVFIEVAGV